MLQRSRKPFHFVLETTCKINVEGERYGQMHFGEAKRVTVQNRMKLKQIKAGVLNIGFEEGGLSSGPPVILLHGFPYDARCFDAAAAQLVKAGRRVIVPYLRGYGPTRFLSADSQRAGQQAALASDLLEFINALNIERTALAGFDWGGRAACVVAALHPDRVASLVSCGTGYNIQNADEVLKPASPETEQRHWYWFYLSSERGRTALVNDRIGFCKYLWRSFSPTWHFTDEVYARTAASFANPDFAAVVLHSYRYRIGAAPGDPALAVIERKLAARPAITVPAIVLAGNDDSVDPPGAPEAVAANFPQLRRQTVLQGVGHNVPQEAPRLFADAILELGS